MQLTFCDVTSLNLTYWIVVQKSQLLSESASLVVEGETCPGLAHQFHQNGSEIKRTRLQAKETH